MKIKKMWIGMLGIIAALGMGAVNLQAQDDGPGPGGPPPGDMGGGPGGPGGPSDGGGNGGQRSNFDPAQFEQHMLEQTRKSLSVTNDDEWAAIQPLIKNVTDARRALGGRGPGPGGPGGDRSGAQNAERQELETAVEQNAPLAQVKVLLAKYRAAQAGRQAKLEAAQAELKSVLTVKQEAAAVVRGLLP